MAIGYLRFPSWLHPEILPWLPIRWYGLMYLAAFTVAYLLLRKQVRDDKLDVHPDTPVNLIFWGIIGLLVGARLFAVIIYDPTGYYLQHPLQIIVPVARVNGRLVFTGLAGMSYHGGLLGAIVACIIYLRVRRLSILEWGDMLIAGVPLGYTFGRLGNFINGELYGRVTTLPWGMIFPQAEPFPAREGWVQEVARRAGLSTAGQEWINLPRHPSQLYEALFEGLVLWAVLWFGLRRRKPFRGLLLAAYLIGYGLIRFVIEYFRQPDAEIGFVLRLSPAEPSPWRINFLQFTTGQILCALMIAAGILLLFVFRSRAATAPASEPGAAEPGTSRPSSPESKSRARKRRRKIR